MSTIDNSYLTDHLVVGLCKKIETFDQQLNIVKSFWLKTMRYHSFFGNSIRMIKENKIDLLQCVYKAPETVRGQRLAHYRLALA